MAESTGFRWRNWSHEQRCYPEAMLRPQTREGLVAAITGAHNAGGRLKVAGSGHSFSGAPLTGGTMVRIEGLDRILDADPSSGLVKVEAGAVLGDLGPRLHELGRGIENLGDIDRQTLAGSISTATHGTGARHQNISAQIEELELITADGTMLRLSEKTDADAFRAARVGLGALGAIYSVTLRTVPAFTLDRTDRPRPLQETLDGLDDLADGIDHFEFFVFPHTSTALCRESTRTDAPPDPPGHAKAYAQEMVMENWVGSGFVQIARRVPSAAPTLARMAAAGFGKSRKIDRSYKVFASERRVRFTEMEYAIPREHAREAVERVLHVASLKEHGVGFPIEVRFVAADDAMLSPCYERDSCYIAVHHDPGSNWHDYFESVAAVMADYDGRPHWGKRQMLGAEALHKLYPRYRDFVGIRNRLDPEGTFSNTFTDRVLGPVAESVKGTKGGKGKKRKR